MHLGGVNEFHPPKTMERSTIDLSIFPHYVETAKYRILDPIRQNPNFSNLGPLLVVPVKFLETGWFGGIRDLENYLIGMARVRLSNLALQIQH